MFLFYCTWSECAGEFSVATLKQAFEHLDSSCDGKLSHGKTIREKKRWCDDAFQLHAAVKYSVLILCPPIVCYPCDISCVYS